VDTERGLLVPVVKDVDRKSLRQFGEEFRRMVDGAPRRAFPADDLSGRDLHHHQSGMYDIDAFTPVINLPEAAILGVGRIAPKAVPRGSSEIRHPPDVDAVAGIRSSPGGRRSRRPLPPNDQGAHRRPGAVYGVHVKRLVA